MCGEYGLEVEEGRKEKLLRIKAILYAKLNTKSNISLKDLLCVVYTLCIANTLYIEDTPRPIPVLTIWIARSRIAGGGGGWSAGLKREPKTTRETETETETEMEREREIEVKLDIVDGLNTVEGFWRVFGVFQIVYTCMRDTTSTPRSHGLDVKLLCFVFWKRGVVCCVVV